MRPADVPALCISLVNTDNPLSMQERTRKAIRDQLKAAAINHAEQKKTQAGQRRVYERKAKEYETEAELEAKDEERTDSRRLSTGSASSQRDGSPVRMPSPGPTKAYHAISGAASLASPNSKANNIVVDKYRPVNSVIRAIGQVANRELGHVGTAWNERNRKDLAKLKREAEQAGKSIQSSSILSAFAMADECDRTDREYRDGTFRLETLRLQRERVTRSAATSFTELGHDLSLTVKGLSRVPIPMSDRNLLTRFDP